MDKEQYKDKELEELLDIWTEMRRVDTEKGWKRINPELQGKLRMKNEKLRLRIILGVAATVVLFLGIGLVFRQVRDMKENQPMLVYAVNNNLPRLILEDGRQIVLDQTDTSGQTIGMQGIEINRSEKSIVYTTKDSLSEGGLKYNILEAPRGAEYKLVLADGTRVWLNADSRLRYPVNFDRQERRVFLEGEAYFQVNKDASRPFRVESAMQTVEVLGTQFNVSAYGDEPEAYTTLVEGSVVVTSLLSGQDLKLHPGQQSVVERQKKGISVREVNTLQVSGWKDGVFVFDDQNLEVILRKVARWYDVETFYKNEAVKSVVFKGNLPRYGKLPDLLKVLESGSGIRFSLKGRSLIVE